MESSAIYRSGSIAVVMFTQLSDLLVVYILSLTLIATLLYREFQQVRFNFNIFFSLLYLLTSYLGFPFTYLLVLCYDVEVVPVDSLLEALLAEISFYGIYYASYKVSLCNSLCSSQQPYFSINRTEIYLLWLLLAFIAVTTFLFFFIQNGFLLFSMGSYNKIFSSSVYGISLKRFFYFFISAMLLIYFSQPTRRRWVIFLMATTTFGILTYLSVGGTRANIAIAFALFLFIGIQRGWITLWMLVIASMTAIWGMFWLALKRYNMSIIDDETFYAFLYLTRDTFSPWENLALLFKNYDHIDFQGFAPIVRDFYVFIPDWIWPDRPSLVINTANYFTWKVLGNHSGLAISPTLIGSLVIMGGIGFIPIGAVIVGLIIKGFDVLYDRGKATENRYYSSLLQSFCFSAIFNIIVLVREGIDAFFSRIVFFCLIFGICLLMAKILFLLFRHAGFIRPRTAKLRSRLRYRYNTAVS